MYHDKNRSNISFPSLNFIQHKKVQLILFSLTLSKMISRVYRTLKVYQDKNDWLEFRPTPRFPKEECKVV